MEEDTAHGMEERGRSQLDPVVAYLHGACLVFLDSLGSGNLSLVF